MDMGWLSQEAKQIHGIFAGLFYSVVLLLLLFGVVINFFKMSVGDTPAFVQLVGRAALAALLLAALPEIMNAAADVTDQLAREVGHLDNYKLLIHRLGEKIGTLSLSWISVKDSLLVLVSYTTYILVYVSVYEIANPTPLKRTREDVEQAARLMLKARLDTETMNPGVWLASAQGLLRDAEQRELKTRSLGQAVVVRAVQIGEGTATADIDRVLSVGDVRSALRTKVTFTFESQAPTESNPYGLRLASLTVLPPEKAAQIAAGAAPTTGGTSK